MGGISIWQLLIIAVIVVLLFGTKKLRNLGTDLGSAIKGFKGAVSDEPAKKDQSSEADSTLGDSLGDNSANKSNVDEKEKDKA